MAADTLSPEERDFLAKCEEELKHRFTENDEEFMKVHNAEPSNPPIIESWWVPNNSGRRNDHRNHRRSHPYAHGNRNHDRRDYRENRGYNDHRRGYEERGYDKGHQGYGNQGRRYDRY